MKPHVLFLTTVMVRPFTQQTKQTKDICFSTDTAGTVGHQFSERLPGATVAVSVTGAPNTKF